MLVLRRLGTLRLVVMADWVEMTQPQKRVLIEVLGNPLSVEAFQALIADSITKITGNLMAAIDSGQDKEVLLLRGQILAWEGLLSRIKTACNDYIPPRVED